MIEIQNALLYGDFPRSFKRLMQYGKFDASTKFQLVKLRKALQVVSEDMKEALSGSDKETAKGLFEMTTSYEFDKIDITNELADHLSADDLFNLEPLLKES